LGVAPPDIDFARKTVTIMESKNKQKRTLPLNGIAIDILKSIRNENKVVNAMGYVFTFNGVPVSKHQLQSHFGKAVKKAGIAHLRFHDLRHTFATRLVQKGHDFCKIGKLLGHKDLKTTQRYAHHCPDSLRDGVESLACKG
jgi:integrase